MVFPSIAYKSDPRETAEWYRAVAKASALPIMIYNNPIAYGVDVSPDVLKMLVDVEEIVCVKEESGDIRRVTDIAVALGDRFSVFCGVDDVIVESMALGVTGWVSGMTNVWPKECVEIFNLCKAEKFAEAREIYRILTPALHLDTHVKLVHISSSPRNSFMMLRNGRARRVFRSSAPNVISSRRRSRAQSRAWRVIARRRMATRRRR